MIRYLRLSTATSIPFGPLVRASDGFSLLATTIAVRASDVMLRKANAAVWSAMASAAVSMPVPGWVNLPLPATDLNVPGPFHLRLNATGVTSATIYPVWVDHYIINQNAYDALFGASGSYLPVNVIQVTGSAPSSAAIGSVANLTTGVAVTSIAAGVGVNVSSINAAVGVNVSSINAAVGVNVSSMGVGVNVLTISGAAVSDAMGGYFGGYFATKIAVQVVTGVLVATAVNAIVATGVLVATTVNANVLTITGGAVSDASIGSVANLATSVAVISIAAGVGVNVSSINAAVGVNVSSINAAVGVNVSSIATGVNVTSINGAAVSTVIPQYMLDYVMNVYGAQSLTVKDYFRVMAAALAGKIAGASTPTGVHIFDPSGTVRVSAVMDAFGNRTSVSWVTG